MQQDSLHIVEPVSAEVAGTDSLTVILKPKVYQPQPLPDSVSEESTCSPTAFGWKELIQSRPVKGQQNLTFTGDSFPRFEFITEQAPLRGIAGDEIPYRFKNDSFVTIVLILSFFLMTWVFTRSRHYLRAQASEYFNTRKYHDSSMDSLHNELNGKALMICQTCFIVGLIFFDITQELQPEVFLHVDPYMILGYSTGICLAYYLLKIVMYRFVNSIFFDRQQCSTWNETYLLHILLSGLFQLPLVLLIIYFDLSFTRLLSLFIGLIILAKTLLLYKCHHIFFNYTLGWVHLFLYFCTLEIVPLLFLFRVMVYANNFLLTIN